MLRIKPLPQQFWSSRCTAESECAGRQVGHLLGQGVQRLSSPGAADGGVSRRVSSQAEMAAANEGDLAPSSRAQRNAVSSPGAWRAGNCGVQMALNAKSAALRAVGAHTADIRAVHRDDVHTPYKMSACCAMDNVQDSAAPSTILL